MTGFVEYRSNWALHIALIQLVRFHALHTVHPFLRRMIGDASQSFYMSYPVWCRCCASRVSWPVENTQTASFCWWRWCRTAVVPVSRLALEQSPPCGNASISHCQNHRYINPLLCNLNIETQNASKCDVAQLERRSLYWTWISRISEQLHDDKMVIYWGWIQIL